jgi:hypothetical protein
MIFKERDKIIINQDCSIDNRHFSRGEVFTIRMVRDPWGSGCGRINERRVNENEPEYLLEEIGWWVPHEIIDKRNDACGECKNNCRREEGVCEFYESNI